MAGEGSAAREWEFSSPGYGDCSITRVRGSGRARKGGGEGHPCPGGWVGGGVSEYFRNVGAAVSRGLCAGCGLLRLRAWGWSIPLPTREWFPTRCPFVLGDLPKKPIPQIHPLLRFLLGVGKVSCPTFYTPRVAQPRLRFRPFTFDYWVCTPRRSTGVLRDEGYKLWPQTHP